MKHKKEDWQSSCYLNDAEAGGKATTEITSNNEIEAVATIEHSRKMKKHRVAFYWCSQCVKILLDNVQQKKRAYKQNTIFYGAEIKK